MKKIAFSLSVFIFLFIPQISLAQNKVLQADLPNIASKNDKNKTAIPKTVNLTKPEESKNELVNSLLGNSGKKPSSLMFDEEEIDNIDKAVDALRSGQTLTIDDSEMTDEERKVKIEKDKKAENDARKATEENEKSYIYLASILYYSPHDWTIWVNNTKISSADNNPKKELYVRAINADLVKIRWTISLSKWKILSGRTVEEVAPKVNAENQVEVEFILKSNQTFILGSNSIIEGHAKVSNKQKFKTSATVPQKKK